MQELYNSLLRKKEYALGDIALRLSLEEVDLLLRGLISIGANEDAGAANLNELKVVIEERIQEEDHNRLMAYDGLRVRILTGIHKDAIGLTEVLLKSKKPISVSFENGRKQTYVLEQIEVIDQDKKKLLKRLSLD